MTKNLLLYILFFAFLSCNTTEDNKHLSQNTADIEVVKNLVLNLEQANRLAQLPFHSRNIEYPNKLNQTIGDATDLKTPKELHSVFYGCFDWHSAVRGHWSLGSLLKDLPDYKHLKNVANKHTNYSLPSIFGGSYEGGHWLGSFAIYALKSIEK